MIFISINMMFISINMIFISISVILISIFMVLLDFFLETGEDPPPGEACEVGAAALYPSAWNAIKWWVISLYALVKL